MTTIAWTSETWNPIRATESTNASVVGWYCQKVSPGCANCYAEAMNRYRGNRHRYNAAGAEGLDIAIDADALAKPLHWKKPRKIFVCSMTDLFLEQHTDEMIAAVFGMMAACQEHTFQVLTKRPERMRDVLSRLSLSEAFLRTALALEDDGFDRWHQRSVSPPWPLPNVWLGVSAEDQERFDQRWPVLRDTPAAVRWVSYEPALGPINFGEAFCELTDPSYRFLSKWYGPDGFDPSGSQPERMIRLRQEVLLHWIVVGGESGRGARDFNIGWARETVIQCRAGGGRPFVKQLGKKPFDWSLLVGRTNIHLVDAKGEDPSEWPEDLRVREYPEARV